ncbi:MAG: hypothetical protein U0324_25460 [Polyangiales bacterium]
MEDIELSVAGVAFRASIDGPCAPDHVEARFGAYRAPAGPDAIELRVRLVDGWRPPRPPSVPYPGAEGTLRDDGSVYFLRETDALLWRPDARRAEGERVGGLSTRPAVVDATPLDTPLRLILSHELPARGGLLVHAAGYGDPRGAVVFMAATGGGKTTTTRKLPHDRVLSDDQVALRREEGTWWAYALPFVGEYARATAPQRRPLRAIALLEKAPSLSLTRVAPGEALARVLRCTVRFVRGGDASALLSLAADLTAATPVWRLALAKDDPVDGALEALLA